ncbi:hypothetical protein HMPREF9444_01817 [Succinatimonas hippei YIT 12066]|uniref:Uncharacterized protein n=1 Tax=Succinatimonas hippei (strain DSM 22608 / JCM 16073 / KCTC 15190 / YIT 12066) TaxID=762983 RepID=E8LM38_SUCHY|nr:hypothetical protein HMPREF9444_01817 [Succinatimonas hippei YIT 12066]
MLIKKYPPNFLQPIYAVYEQVVCNLQSNCQEQNLNTAKLLFFLEFSHVRN